jgi:hypothetical protein
VGELARLFDLRMQRVVAPETVRKVCLYRPLTRSSSPATDGFAEFLTDWIQRWHAQRPPARRRPGRPAAA